MLMSPSISEKSIYVGRFLRNRHFEVCYSTALSGKARNSMKSLASKGSSLFGETLRNYSWLDCAATLNLAHLKPPAIYSPRLLIAFWAFWTNVLEIRHFSLNTTIWFPDSAWELSGLQALPTELSQERRLREAEPPRQRVPRQEPQEPGNERTSVCEVAGNWSAE